MAGVGDAEGLGSQVLIHWSENLDLPSDAPTATVPKPSIGPPKVLHRLIKRYFCFCIIPSRDDLATLDEQTMICLLHIRFRLIALLYTPYTEYVCAYAH
jgi:hypothetical protein